MKTLTFNNQEEWLKAREQRITGTRLDKVTSSYTKADIMKRLDGQQIEYNKSDRKAELEKKHLGTSDRIALKLQGEKPLTFYKILAERIALPATDENVMDRGHRLEEVAIKRFEEDTGKEVNTDLMMWVDEDREYSAISPDGAIEKKEAVEVKSLSTAKHLKALIEQEIPDEYWEQVYKYFIVNDELEKLYFVFFDGRCPVDMHYIVIERKDIEDQIEEFTALEDAVMEEVYRLEKELTF